MTVSEREEMKQEVSVNEIADQLTKEGFIKFLTLGGWFDQVLLGQRVLVKTHNGDVTGVIGAMTRVGGVVHLGHFCLGWRGRKNMTLVHFVRRMIRHITYGVIHLAVLIALGMIHPLVSFVGFFISFHMLLVILHILSHLCIH